MFIQTYQSLNDIYLLIKSPKRKYNPGISKGTALADTDIFLVDDLKLVNTHLVFNSQVVGHHLETGVGGLFYWLLFCCCRFVCCWVFQQNSRQCNFLIKEMGV